MSRSSPDETPDEILHGVCEEHLDRCPSPMGHPTRPHPPPAAGSDLESLNESVRGVSQGVGPHPVLREDYMSL